jgi:erythromycin esterase
MLTLIGVAAAVFAQGMAAASSVTDGRVNWLAENATPVRSIDPRMEDYSDLQFLKAAIGGARVVQLGEQSHGDGAVFLAKARLVKFLHKEMGFDVLVWESGMFDCREADWALQDPTRDVEDAWKEGVFGVWAASAQVRPLLEYIRATESAPAQGGRRLEVAGYDCQFSSGRVERWLDSVAAFAKPLGEDHPATRVIEALKREQSWFTDGQAPEGTLEGIVAGLGNLGQLLDASRERLVASHGEAEVAFMRRTVDDAVATVRMTQAYANHKGGDLNVRDQRMGENLLWLARERYKGRKLIVWAASMHEVHDVTAIRPSFNPGMYKGTVTAGTVAHGTLGAAMYTVAFETFDGRAGRWFSRAGPLAEAPKGSLAELMSGIERPYAFVDLRGLPQGHWLRGRVTMRPLGYAPMEAEWAKQVDGVFYIRTMFPATRWGMAPEGVVLTVK